MGNLQLIRAMLIVVGLATTMAMEPTKYLTKYGYLDDGMMSKASDMTPTEMDDMVRDAVMLFQEMAHLPMTGRLDEMTMQQMSMPRCGVADLGEFRLTGRKWDKTHLTYRLINTSPQLDRAEVEDAIYRAFRIWEQVTPLRFSRTSGTSDIEISFVQFSHGDGNPFDGRGGTLAHAYFPGTGIGGDAHFDESEQWTVRTARGTNLFIVAAHEFGHSLGLEHSQVLGALMYPFYQGYVEDFQLDYDDILGIQTIYGSNPNPGNGNPNPDPPTTPPSGGEPTPPTGGGNPNPPTGGRPDICNTDIDAISRIRGETWVFKGKYFWRVRDQVSGPWLTSSFWRGLPEHLDRIDGIYERPDYKILIFKGRRYWVFDANILESGPHYISDLGLPSHLDAVMPWRSNGRTYFFKGNQYWRYNEAEGRVDSGYPRALSIWRGIPTDSIDAAVQHDDGYAYFFKGQDFYKMAERTITVLQGYPKRAAQNYFGCRPDSFSSGPGFAPMFAGSVQPSGLSYHAEGHCEWEQHVCDLLIRMEGGVTDPLAP
ncbi:collagenase 3-like [Branchiostoma floridae x Branchiostoma japonicum]